jgi:hypothetical protein
MHPIAHAMYWSNSFSGGVLIALAAAGLGFAALGRTAHTRAAQPRSRVR